MMLRALLSAALSAAPCVVSGEERLTIVNGCQTSPLWIAHLSANQVGPGPQDVKIDTGGSARFHTSQGGGALPATRFWPKMGCDSTGNNCSIGDSGGPGEGCVIRRPQGDDYSHCAPPFDTKLEATFAAPGAPVNDVLDMSLVDGYTLPFKLETSGGMCTRDQQYFESMDCSVLSLEKCPTSESIDGKTMTLQGISPKSRKQVGCFSPCMRLTDDKWNISTPVAPDSAVAGPYCCAGAFGSPQTCSNGPIQQTQYLKAVRDSCPMAYGYAFDDVVATIACQTSTQYTLTFYCPTVPAPSSTPTLSPRPKPTPTPAPIPKPLPSACPGRSLAACIGACPSDLNDRKACATSCGEMCHLEHVVI